jgi:hypothetical protein
MVERLAVEAVAGADFQLVEPVEHVELGQRDPGDSRDPAGLAHQRGVEPAAAALAPGHRAELMAALAEALADRVMQFGREGPRAHARGVGLDDAEREVDGVRPDARAHRRHARQRVGRGDVGIGAEIDVEQRALRALEQDARALAAALGQQLPDRRGEGREPRRHRQQFRDQRGAVDGRLAEPRRSAS